VARGHALAPQGARGAGDLVAQGIEGVRTHGARDGAVIDERELLATPALDMAIQGVEAGVEPAAPEPPVVGRPRVVQDLVPSPDPVDIFCRGGPESLGVAHRPLVDLFVSARHVPSFTLGRERAMVSGPAGAG